MTGRIVQGKPGYFLPLEDRLVAFEIHTRQEPCVVFVFEKHDHCLRIFLTYDCVEHKVNGMFNICVMESPFSK